MSASTTHGDDGEIGELERLAGDLAERNSAAGEAGEAVRDVTSEDRLAAADQERSAGEDRQRRKRRDERQNADDADQHAVDRAADKADCKRDCDRRPDRIAEREENGGDDAGEARHRADAEVEVSHDHDDGHRRSHDRQHADLLGDVEPVSPGHEGLGQAHPEEEEDGDKPDQRAVAPEERRQASRLSRASAAGDASAARAPSP